MLLQTFLCIESFLYMTHTVCIFLEKTLNKILLFIVNLGYKDIKIIEGHTLAYLTLAQYDSLRLKTATMKELSLIFCYNIRN